MIVIISVILFVLLPVPSFFQVFPRIERIRDVSLTVAAAVATTAQYESVATVHKLDWYAPPVNICLQPSFLLLGLHGFLIFVGVPFRQNCGISYCTYQYTINNVHLPLMCHFQAASDEGSRMGPDVQSSVMANVIVQNVVV